MKAQETMSQSTPASVKGIGSLVAELRRNGDDYEFYPTTQEIVNAVASPILRAPLTTRGDTPMCGVPIFSLDTYLAKLIRAGKTVALADYAEDTRRGQLTRREITRVIAPGT